MVVEISVVSGSRWREEGAMIVSAARGPGPNESEGENNMYDSFLQKKIK
jgi:hypothetical protein